MNHENSIDQTDQANRSNNPWLREGLFDGVKRLVKRPEQKKSEETQALDYTSPDLSCQFYLDSIKHLGRAEKVSSFIHEALGRQAAIYDSIDDFYAANPDYDEQTYNYLSWGMKDALKEYSGYNFSWINNIERGIWDYEKMGRRTPELEARYRETADIMDAAIQSAPAPNEDFITFRGTNLDSFRDYKITSIGELAKMKGKFMLEKGFMSTALVRDNSFAARDVSGFFIGKSNIEIHYHIPKESHDAVALFDPSLSYSPSQTEVLINRHTLNYISDVTFDDQGRAIVDMLMVPSNLYDY